MVVLTKKYPLYLAAFLTVLLADLYAPSGLSYDFPLIPPISRDSIALVSLFLLLKHKGTRISVTEPRLLTFALFGYLAAICISSFTNQAPVVMPNLYLPGLSAYDALSSIVKFFLEVGAFFIGKSILSDTSNNRAIFKTFVGAMLIYTIFMLLEVRISPQLHMLVYGYMPSEFLQQIRDGGYRPMVFHGHGLGLAFLFSTAIICFIALYKNREKVSVIPNLALLIYLAVVLVLCKTLSAIIYASLAWVLINRLKPSKQITLSMLMACVIFIYPIVKMNNVLPEKEINEFFKSINPDRAQSLEFRMKNENMLIAHDNQNFWFGWGGWGRDRVYDKWGNDITVTDGKWIIQIGYYGIVGFTFYYLILISPLYYARKAVLYIKDDKEKAYFSALAIILMISIIDSIPNTGMGSIHFLLAGALLGQSQRLIQLKKYESPTLPISQ